MTRPIKYPLHTLDIGDALRITDIDYFAAHTLAGRHGRRLGRWFKVFYYDTHEGDERVAFIERVEPPTQKISRVTVVRS